VVRRALRWVLFPPDTPEEWVAAETYQREGEDDEAIDYFNLFLPRIREAHPELEVYDFVQQPGETIFVPGGWWHAVLNIDVTIACTQNFASRENWDVVWRSTRYGESKRGVWSPSGVSHARWSAFVVCQAVRIWLLACLQHSRRTTQSWWRVRWSECFGYCRSLNTH